MVCFAYPKENGLTSITLPSHLAFMAWGPLTKSLLESDDQGSDFTAPDLAEHKSHGVTTLEPVTLNATQPCRVTRARAILSPVFNWSKPQSRFADHYWFQAMDVGITPDFEVTPGRWADNDKSPESIAVQTGSIVGTPVADIADAVALKEGEFKP